MYCKEFQSLHSGLTHVLSVRFPVGQNLFVLGQHIIKDVEKHVNMVLLEHQ